MGFGLVEARSLAGNEEHDPTEDDYRADEEHEAVSAVAKHLPRSVAHGDAKDGGSEEREEHNGGEVGGLHQDFLPVRRLCASTAAMMLRRPATTINLVPYSATVVWTGCAPQPASRPRK